MNLPAELLERCDLVIVNESEYTLIPALAGAKLVAVTYGKDGSAMFEHGQKVAEAPSAAVAVANTVGARDAFCAALVLTLRQGLDYAHALAGANAAGGDAVGDPSSQPDLAQLGYYVERTAVSEGADIAWKVLSGARLRPTIRTGATSARGEAMSLTPRWPRTVSVRPAIPKPRSEADGPARRDMVGSTGHAAGVELQQPLNRGEPGLGFRRQNGDRY